MMIHFNLSSIPVAAGLVIFLAAAAAVRGIAAETPDVSSAHEKFACPPTQADSLGPFYKPDAPLRSAVGEGYVLQGTVRSAVDCSPIPNARIEFWLAGPDGDYGDRHRAAIVTQTGKYRFESNTPSSYGFRPPHIHIRVSAKGYRTLVTQHYPDNGASQGSMDLVLVPES